MRNLERKCINKIVELKLKGLTINEIAKMCNIGVSSVKKYTKDIGIYKKKKKPGRPKKLSKKISKAIVNDFKSNKLKYLSDGCFKVSTENNIEVSKDTISRCLKNEGLNCYKKQKKPELTENREKSRFEFSEKFLNYNYQDWRRVIWSDESSFEVANSSRTEYYWSKKCDPLNEKNIKKTKKFGGGSVMVWGCITPYGVGKLVKIDGNLNSQKYTEVLQKGLFETIDHYKLMLDKMIFMHDNAPIHSSKHTKEWLTTNKVATIE